MNRREILQWLSRGMATIVAAIIGLPGIRYLSGSVPSSTEPVSDYQRLKRLQDLPAGRPVMVPVLGCKRDAWVQSDQQVVGRIWLVRRPAASNAGKSEVHAFNSVCPHMGCQIQAQASNRGFVCPCHRAAFGLNGLRQNDAVSQEENHAPRDMDSLACRVVRDPSSGDAWVEVKFQTFELGSKQRVTRS